MSRAPASEARGSTGRLAGEADVRNRDEVPFSSGCSRRQQERHAIDDQRLHHAVHQALAQPQQVEIAVQIPRETRPAHAGSRTDRGSRRRSSAV